jgi:hypothetical protein
MRSLADRLASIPGVVAVTLGGSRATGAHGHDSDWDFGLYYRGTISPDDVRALGWPGQVFAPGDWGRLVNGGAWLRVDGTPVDLIYRDLDVVARWTAEAEAGRFRIDREVGYVAGIATYVLAGELAVNEVLHGRLPRPSFPPRLGRRPRRGGTGWRLGRWSSGASTPTAATGSPRWRTSRKPSWPPPKDEWRPPDTGR